MAGSGRALTVLLCGWIGNAAPQDEPSPEAGSAPRPPAENPAWAVFPADPSRDVVIRACAPCHAPEIVVAKRRSADEWDRIIVTMVDRGALADDGEQARILDYLVHFFGPAADGGGSARQ